MENKELVPVENNNVVPFIRNKSILIQNYENAVTDLLNTKAFYAKLIMSMRKDFSVKDLPTAAVGIKSTGFTLYLNPDFFNNLSRMERVGALEHEALHVLHAHFARFNNFQDKDRKLANLACDVAINQYIPHVPKQFKVLKGDKVVDAFPATYERLLKEIPDLLPKMSSEYYFSKFKEEVEKNGGSGIDGEETLDDHGQWDDTDLTKEQLEKFVKSHIKAILESCSDQEKQQVDKSIIDELFRSEINWKAQLRQFFANSEETFTETTRKKRNRRYGLLQAGYKNEQKLRLVIANDTSGSVSDEELQLFYGEIDRIYNEQTMELWIMDADTKVQNCFQYKKGMKIEAKGRGGTAYGAAFLKAKELRADAFIYFGDMDCSDIPVKPRFPVLWGIVRNQKPPVPWGKAIYIKA